MNDDFFNQGIEKFSGQFCGIGVLLDESDPLFGIQSSLLLCGQFRLQAADFFLQLQLFCLVLFRQQIEVIFGDASADQSSYIRTNFPSTSALRFSTRFSSDS